MSVHGVKVWSNNLGSNLVVCCSTVSHSNLSRRDKGTLPLQNIMGKSGPFQVLKLKVLVTRQVMRDRMEYKDHLGGIAKDELDQLDRLEGKFFVHAAVMEVRRRGKILSNDEWKSLKTSGLPKVIIRFLDSKKKEFSILERSNHGKREWELQDVDGSSKKFNFSSTVTDDHGGWRHKEQFIIDGQLTTYRCLIHPEGKRVMTELDIFSIDCKGNVLRTISWVLPTLQIEITKDIWTRREEGPRQH